MNKFLSVLATFILLTGTAKAGCPEGSVNCNLQEGSNQTQGSPCGSNSTSPYYAKGAPDNIVARNANCGANVMVYPLDEEARMEYMRRGLPVGGTYAPRSTAGAYPDGRYGSFAPRGDYNLPAMIDSCVNGGIDSKDHNVKIECLDAFDRALNDPSYGRRHKELISTLVGFLKVNTPMNGAIDRPDLNMATEILARNHRLDRDGCFTFEDLNMTQVRDYLDSRSNVVCNNPNKKPILMTTGSYNGDGLNPDEQVEVLNCAYDGIDYKTRFRLNDKGEFIDVLTKELLIGPDGNPIVPNGKYRIDADGMRLVGPYGEKYSLDANGNYVLSEVIGPNGERITIDGKDFKLDVDGKTIIGPNGERYTVNEDGTYSLVEVIGPDGEIITVGAKYKLDTDGKTVIGPNGEKYTLNEEGEYVLIEAMGPDGEVLVIDGINYKLAEDGKTIVGPNGETYSFDITGKYVLNEVVGPNGEVITATSEYRFAEDGKTIIGPNGEKYVTNEFGEYVLVEVVGPDGNVITATSEYRFAEDGETVIGPNGEEYTLNEFGEYVLSEVTGPDGERIVIDGQKYRLDVDGKTIIGPNGERYTVNEDGEYVLVKMIGPDGKPLDEYSDYVVSKDGKTVLGPNGEVYTIDVHGRYIGPDGKPVIGIDGRPIGPNGTIFFSREEMKTLSLQDAQAEEKYKELLEENKKLDEARGAEDKLIDAEISSNKFTTEKQIAALSCNPSSCEARFIENDDVEDVLEVATSVLENRKADIASRLDAICTLKCVSIEDRDLEPEAIETLANYVRRRTPWPLTPKPKPEYQTKSVRPDVQAALIVIGGKDRTSDLGKEINLTAVDFRGANLEEANLENVDLSFSNLATTNLKNAGGLTHWDRINLVAIDDTTLIPEALSAGYKVRRKPNILPVEAGSFKIVTDDWTFWKSILVEK